MSGYEYRQVTLIKGDAEQLLRRWVTAMLDLPGVDADHAAKHAVYQIRDSVIPSSARSAVQFLLSEYGRHRAGPKVSSVSTNGTQVSIPRRHVTVQTVTTATSPSSRHGAGAGAGAGAGGGAGAGAGGGASVRSAPGAGSTTVPSVQPELPEVRSKGTHGVLQPEASGRFTKGSHAGIAVRIDTAAFLRREPGMYSLASVPHGWAPSADEGVMSCDSGIVTQLSFAHGAGVHSYAAPHAARLHRNRRRRSLADVKQLWTKSKDDDEARQRLRRLHRHPLAYGVVPPTVKLAQEQLAQHASSASTLALYCDYLKVYLQVRVLV